MARSTTRTHWLGRTAIAAAALLATTALAAPAASARSSAEAHGGFRQAPTAVQPTASRTSVAQSTVKSAARRSAVATTTTAPPGCGGVTIATGTSPAGYLPLSLFGTPPIAGVGDDTNTQFTVPAFTYNGVSYSQVQVDSNGYVQVGGSSTVSVANQNFPDPTAPNNVLAPFWTDLNPGAAGAVRINTLTDGADTWVVVDWDAVREFSNSSNLHSFEVWIGVDGDAHPGQDITYAYGSNTGTGDSGLLTVGAENFDGTSGGVTAFNGAGTVPANGDQLRVSSAPPYAVFTASPSAGNAPLHVTFDGSGSSDDGSLVSYAWNFGDSTTGSGVSTTHDYAPGIFHATLTVTDNDGNSCVSPSQQITSNGGFSVNDVSVNEAAGTATFTVSRAGGGAASVDVAAAPGTATTPADFTAAPATLSFAAGELSKPYVVTIHQDSLDENNENYTVNLSAPVNGSVADGTGIGTIVDDDPVVRLSVNDVNVVEGNVGTTALSFKVRLNRASAKQVRVSVHTANGSAHAPADYATRNFVLTFAPGQTVLSVPVAVVGDHVREPNETLFLLLNNPVNATISDANGTGGIINDD